MSIRPLVVVLSLKIAVCGDTNESETSGPKPDGSKRIFVTDDVFTGALGGLSGADAKCQAEADAASLGGRYVAWLGSANASAPSRFTPHWGPYVLVTGDVVATSFSTLKSGQLEHAIDRTAAGREPRHSRGKTYCGGNLVWTATKAYGEYSGADCKGWTSASEEANPWPSPALGIAGATSAQWTSWCYGMTCNLEAHLYCIEQ
jgi:hypothetical protein